MPNPCDFAPAGYCDWLMGAIPDSNPFMLPAQDSTLRTSAVNSVAAAGSKTSSTLTYQTDWQVSGYTSTSQKYGLQYLDRHNVNLCTANAALHGWQLLSGEEYSSWVDGSGRNVALRYGCTPLNFFSSVALTTLFTPLEQIRALRWLDRCVRCCGQPTNALWDGW
jgi:hypothetical protein